jgi:hypothetical protein
LLGLAINFAALRSTSAKAHKIPWKRRKHENAMQATKCPLLGVSGINYSGIAGASLGNILIFTLLRFASSHARFSLEKSLLVASYFHFMHTIFVCYEHIDSPLFLFSSLSLPSLGQMIHFGIVQLLDGGKM